MKIETTRPKRYKGCFIVGVVIEAPRLYGWRAQGIIYAVSGQELKRVNYLRHSIFTYKKYAKDAGLRMCRYWIANHSVKLDRLIWRHRKTAAVKPKKRRIGAINYNKRARAQYEARQYWEQF